MRALVFKVGILHGNSDVDACCSLRKISTLMAKSETTERRALPKIRSSRAEENSAAAEQTWSGWEVTAASLRKAASQLSSTVSHFWIRRGRVLCLRKISSPVAKSEITRKLWKLMAQWYSVGLKIYRSVVRDRERSQISFFLFNLKQPPFLGCGSGVGCVCVGWCVQTHTHEQILEPKKSLIYISLLKMMPRYCNHPLREAHAPQGRACARLFFNRS